MNSTPNSLRRHIGIFGETNAGKSALFNRILSQEMAIVSEKEGTTTDPVSKAMELISFGPVVVTDTAGLLDNTELAKLRDKKTQEIFKETDCGILVVDYKNYNKTKQDMIKEYFKKYEIPYITVISKADILSDDEFERANKEFNNPLFASVYDNKSIADIKEALINMLKNLPNKEPLLLEGLVKSGDNAVLVVPVDSEAPKGRLILPQVQLIRECLDSGVLCHVCTDNDLEKMLEELKETNIVITDSQAFKRVNEIVPADIRLTSFSMLMARSKGDLKLMSKGINAIDKLCDGDCVLISEVCTHTTSHEDIGREKIPKLLTKKTGKKLNFEFLMGKDFPEDLSKYKLIIHCGGCMITRKAMMGRLKEISSQNVPVVNYGVILAYLSGAYDRQRFLLTNN